jgi:hypothetical protein
LHWIEQLAAEGITGGRGGVPADPERAAPLLEQAAQAGRPLAAAFLGQQHWSGNGVVQDRPRALELLQSAAEQGVATAQEFLGWMHVSGNAAEAEHRLAALWLAEVYEKGLGVEPDARRAEALRVPALEAASVTEKNAFAWELSVRSDALLRNGPLAVRIMERALEAPGAATPARIDTLAAAYAEAERFEAAIAAQQRALAALPPDANEASAAFRERLALYRAGEAYRRP